MTNTVACLPAPSALDVDPCLPASPTSPGIGRRALLGRLLAGLSTAAVANVAAVVVTRSAPLAEITPPAALSPAEPDPIFAAIERHRDAQAAWEAAYNEHGLAEERFDNLGLEKPAVWIPVGIAAPTELLNPDFETLKFQCCHDASDIDAALATNCSLPCGTPAARREAAKRLRSEQARYAQARSDLTQAEDRNESATHHQNAMLRELALTVPTTSAGVAAVLGHWMAYHLLYYGADVDCDEDDLGAFLLLKSVHVAMGRIAATTGVQS